jgi:hypothetical protein
MAFLEANPGVALPSSSESSAEAPADIETPLSTEEGDEEEEVNYDEEEAEQEADDDNDDDEEEEEEEEEEATPTESETESETTPADADAAAPVCPEGETPLILYLDSGSSGEYESCAAASNGTAAYYFVARAGDAEARTFALPEVRGGGGLGCVLGGGSWHASVVCGGW